MLLGFGGPPKMETFEVWPEIGRGGGIENGVADGCLFRYFIRGVILSY